MVTVSGNPNRTNPTTKYRCEFVNLFCIYAEFQIKAWWCVLVGLIWMSAPGRGVTKPQAAFGICLCKCNCCFYSACNCIYIVVHCGVAEAVPVYDQSHPQPWHRCLWCLYACTFWYDPSSQSKPNFNWAEAAKCLDELKWAKKICSSFFSVNNAF